MCQKNISLYIYIFFFLLYKKIIMEISFQIDIFDTTTDYQLVITLISTQNRHSNVDNRHLFNIKIIYQSIIFTI